MNTEKEELKVQKENEVGLSSDEDEDANQYTNSCRFYRNEVPAENDLVFVEIFSMEQAGAYVRLIEYDNIHAFLLYSEVSRQRIKSVKKYISVGKCEMMDVRRVDVKTKSVDLSRKSIKPEDRQDAMDRFKKAKKVHAIMRVTAVALKTNALKLYEDWGWDLYDKFDHAYDAFRIALAEPE